MSLGKVPMKAGGGVQGEMWAWSFDCTLYPVDGDLYTG